MGRLAEPPSSADMSLGDGTGTGKAQSEKIQVLTAGCGLGLAGILLLACSGSGDAYGVPLYKQIQAGVENRHLECSNQDHFLAMSPSLNFACVTAESSERAGWPGVTFAGDGDTVVSQALEVKVGGEIFGVNATITNGMVTDSGFGRYFGDAEALRLTINPVEDGRAVLEIPRPVLFHTPGPYADEGARFVVDVLPMEGSGPGYIVSQQEVGYNQDRYVVHFSFWGRETEYAVILAVLV